MCQSQKKILCTYALYNMLYIYIIYTIWFVMNSGIYTCIGFPCLDDRPQGPHDLPPSRHNFPASSICLLSRRPSWLKSKGHRDPRGPRDPRDFRDPSMCLRWMDSQPTSTPKCARISWRWCSFFQVGNPLVVESLGNMCLLFFRFFKQIQE